MLSAEPSDQPIIDIESVIDEEVKGRSRINPAGCGNEIRQGHPRQPREIELVMPNYRINAMERARQQAIAEKSQLPARSNTTAKMFSIRRRRESHHFTGRAPRPFAF